MAVTRQANLQGNQRVDVAHLRSIESGVAGDFDLLAGTMFAGRAPQIISGFYLVSTGITSAVNLKLRVAGSSLIHYLAAESGSIFNVPANRADELLNTTNPRIIGSFTPSQVNYVGLDFTRLADDTTVDVVEFIDSNSKLETPVTLPLARTTDYRIVISTLDFDNNPGIAPVAKVTTDAAGNITALEDARPHMFRLGSGGTTPDIHASFPWPAGRKENTSGDTFVGGDKAIQDFKAWMDSIMTRLMEVGGGEYWYSPTSTHNERFARTGSPFSNGEYFEWSGSNLHWKGLSIIFANSTGVFNIIANQTTDVAGITDLADGECIYVDVDRTQNRSGGSSLLAAKGSLSVLGMSTVPGARWVIAWRYGANIFTRDQSYFVGAAFILATVAASGMVKLSASSANGSTPTAVATVDAVSFEAKAAGLSRGFRAPQLTPTLSTDFIGGSGDLLIGGGYDGADGHGAGNPVDFNVVVATVRAQDETKVTGIGTFGNGVAAFSATNTGVGAGQFLSARFRGVRNVGAEDTHHFFNDGAMGWCNVLGDVTPTPAPAGGRQIRSKMFFRTNGLTTPDTRDQLCVVWFDGTVTKIAEGPAY